jgi:hypothetical protein
MFIVIILFILAYFLYIYLGDDKIKCDDKTIKSIKSIKPIKQIKPIKSIKQNNPIKQIKLNKCKKHKRSKHKTCNKLIKHKPKKILCTNSNLILFEDFTNFDDKIQYALWNYFIFPDFSRYDITVEASDGKLTQHGDHITVKTQGLTSSRPYNYYSYNFMINRHIHLDCEFEGFIIEFTLSQHSEDVSNVKLTQFKTYYNLTLQDPDDDYRLICSGVSLMLNNNTTQINLLMCKNKIYLMQSNEYFVAVYKLMDRNKCDEDTKYKFVLCMKIDGLLDVFIKYDDLYEHLLTIKNMGIRPCDINKIVANFNKCDKCDDRELCVKNLDIGFGNFNYFGLMDLTCDYEIIPSTVLLGFEKTTPVLDHNDCIADSIVSLPHKRSNVSKIINYGQQTTLKMYELKVFKY